MNRKYISLMPCIIFAILIFISFRNIIYTPGFVGHTWDWGLPHFKEQYIDKIKNLFFIWDDTTSGGRYQYFKFELFFWFIVFPLSLFGGETASKAIPMAFLLIAGLSMYRLCRYYNIRRFWSSMAGVYYMFSSIAYSKVIAGHLTVLLCYSLLPLVILFFQKIVDDINNRKRILFKDIFLASLLFTIQFIAHPMNIISILILGVLLVWHWFFSIYKWRFIKITSAIVLLVTLMNGFWLLPAVSDYLSTRSLGSGAGVSYVDDVKVSFEKELSIREGYVRSTQALLSSGIRAHARTGMGADFIWPIPDKFKITWLLISFLACLLFFGILLIQRQGAVYLMGPYLIIAILNIMIVSGYNTPYGNVIYKILNRFFPLIYMLFSRTPRLLISLNVSYAIGIFYFLNILEDSTIRKRIFRPMGIFGLLILTLPFINGNMNKPLSRGRTQPFSVQVNKINPEDKLVYDFFKANPDDFRISYLPPALMSWPGVNTDLSYEWNVILGLSPKPEFFGIPYSSPLSYGFTQSLYSLTPSPYLGKLLGLANVRYIVYPHYSFFVSFKDFIPGYYSPIVAEGFKDYKPIVDKSLSMQKGLKKMDAGFKTVTIFENSWFKPHIYASTGINLAFGSERKGFVPLSYTDCFDDIPVIFINSNTEWIRLKNKTDCYIANVFATLTEDKNRVEFYAPSERNFLVEARMSPNYVFNRVVEDEYNLTFFFQEELAEWTIIPNNIKYDYKLEEGMGLVLSCEFDGDRTEDEYIQFKRDGLKIDLLQYPWIELNYKVEDNGVQTIELVSGLDFDRDGIVDEYLKGIYPRNTSEVFDYFSINLLSLVFNKYPDKKYYDLVEMELYPHKLWGVDCKDTLYEGDFLFYIRNIRFVNYKQERFIKNNFVMFEKKWDGIEGEMEKWDIKRGKADIDITNIGKSIVVEKEQEFIELSRLINEPVDISKWEYIAFEYIAPLDLVKKIRLFIGLDGIGDVYVSDLYASDELIKFNLNLNKVLGNLNPKLNSTSVNCIKFLIKENNIIKNEMGSRKKDVFTIKQLEFYSLQVPQDIALKKYIISIDDNKFWYEHKAPMKDETAGFYFQDKINLSSGWHSANWGAASGEYYNLDYVVIRSVKDGRAVMNGPNLDFYKINPAKYIVNIKDVKEPFWLVFLENFHKGWKAYVKPKDKNSILGQKKWLENSAIMTWLKTRNMKKLREHFKINGYANGWWIDPNKIKDGSGSGGLEVIIEFKPQRFYEFGLIVAGLVIIAGFGAVLAGVFKK